MRGQGRWHDDSHRRWHRPRRLYTRLYLHFVGMLMVVALLGVFGLMAEWHGEWEGKWRSNPVHELAERFAGREAAALSRDMADPTARQAVVLRLAADLDIDVTLRDPGGQLLCAAGAALPSLSAQEVRLLASGPRMLVRHRKGPIFAAALVPDPHGGAPLGALELSMARHMQFRLVRPLIGPVHRPSGPGGGHRPSGAAAVPADRAPDRGQRAPGRRRPVLSDPPAPRRLRSAGGRQRRRDDAPDGLVERYGPTHPGPGARPQGPSGQRLSRVALSPGAHPGGAGASAPEPGGGGPPRRRGGRSSASWRR